ncbi:hypothetical protein DL767_004336 [Monosporascus sp. MG133]|nr:hypothetical protein DL767_004336 [Monosporascus sp. MG133]
MHGEHSRALSKVSKDVIYEILEGTLSILCMEDIDSIIEHMKPFWVVVMEETRDSGTCSDAERGLLRKATSDVPIRLESRLERLWQQSSIEFLLLDEAAIRTPAYFTSSDASLLSFAAATAQNADELRSR